MGEAEAGIGIERKNIYVLTCFIVTGVSAAIESIGIWVSLSTAFTASVILYYSGFRTENFLTERQSLGIISVFTLVGLFVRLDDLGSYSLWYDEAISSIAIESLVETGKPLLESGKVYIRGFPHLLLGAVSSSILGSSDFALRLPSALTGTLTVPLTYLLGKELFDRETGVTAAFLIAFSTWQIVWSRQVRMYSLLQLLYLASILLIYRTGNNLEPKNILLTAFTITLACMTHVTGYILPVIAIIYLTWQKYTEIEFKGLIKIFLPLAAVSLVVQKFYFSYRNLLTRLTFSPGNAVTYLNWLGENISILLLLGIAGILPSFKDKRKGSVLMLLSTIPTAYIYLFHVETAASRYLYVLVPFFAVWSGFLVARILRGLDLGKKFSGFLVLVFLISVFVSGSFVSGDYRPGLSAPQPDFESAYSYVSDRMDSEDVVISGWTPPAVHYLDNPPEYTLVGRYFGIDEREFNGSERYSDADFITKSSELETVIREYQGGWIVLDERAWRGQRSGVKDILDSISLEKKFYEIKVWSWKNTSELNY